MKQAIHDYISGITKQYVPYGNEVQHLQHFYNDAKDDHATLKAYESLESVTEDMAAKNSRGAMAKIANVFESS